MKYSQSFCAINTFNSIDILDKLIKNGTKHIHIDFMDGYFVDNFGATYQQVEFLIKRYPNVHFDAHLMLEKPLNFINKLVNLGFHTIFLPSESVNIKIFKQLLNDYPTTTFGIMIEAKDHPKDFVEIINLSTKILVMTINIIGGTGQELNLTLLNKVKEIKEIKHNIIVFSDGGLRKHNAKDFYINKVDIAVGGSIIFSFEKIKEFSTWWKENF
ncbi:ribulose-5-phosphate 3-epimerase [Mycoplasmopsis mustelae]|uniref:Ribulose-5-phosphate 3-epimerase n=1 Tax=Mycoplasmopsis mustelae TaxID=171289 RepID=A0A4R7UDW1_9BACT|nr:ribulose phosphate epimerase [Mycoplasmopsis mustelae]TDV23532.1 ribulose-5-phosphate 3-epimerase [Mycoplasmopsis mustelae]